MLAPDEYYKLGDSDDLGGVAKGLLFYFPTSSKSLLIWL